MSYKLEPITPPRRLLLGPGPSEVSPEVLDALSRPLIWEPDLPRRWQQGDTSKAKCISCNGCFRPGLKEGGIRCVVPEKSAS